MKKTLFLGIILISVFFDSTNVFSQIFPSLNVSLISRWQDTNVVSIPSHGLKYNGVFGWANPLDNREYAIIGSNAGTYFIEVTDPSQPIVRDYVPGKRDSCVWRELHTYKNFCYMVSDDPLPNSFQIVDLSYLPDSVFVVHDSTNIMSRCHTIFIDGDKLYGGTPKGPFGQSSMGVFSLKNNPASPFLLRRLEEDYTGLDATHDMFVRNDTIYASMSFGGYFAFLFDTLLNKFIMLGSLTQYPFEGYNHSSSLTENGKYTVMCDEVDAGLPVKIVDVMDFTNMNVVTTFQSNVGATPHNPYVIGNDRVVIAYYQDGVQIFDISNPASPVRCGYFDTRPEIGDNNGYPGDPYQGCWGAYTKLPSGILLASDMQNGLFILDASAALGKKELFDKSFGLEIIPNPNNGFFKIRGSGIQGEKIILFNILGKKLLERKISEKAGFWVENFELNYPDGIYFINVSGKDFSQTLRFVME